MKTSETRKAERITGLEVEWEPDSRQALGVKDGLCLVVASAPTLKQAVRLLLERNLGRIRLQKLQETKGACERCGRHGPSHLHHVKKRSQRRDDRAENMRLICWRCHDAEHRGVR